jgi:membrane-bound ClpP family serine protease
LSVDDGQDEGSHFRRSPTGPRVAPPRQPIDRSPMRPPHPGGKKWRYWSVVVFVLLISGVGIRAYRDLSRPDAWAYWKESYLSPSMTSALIPSADFDGSGHSRRALAISGMIGAATANWLRDRLDETHLAAGDAVLLSSPGGELNQAVIMGEIIRSRGLVTAVGVIDASGHVRPAYCASACVLVFAGGKIRYGVEGSMLGVHQFEAAAPLRDPVASTQRVAGMLLSYMTKMGVSSAVVEAMSQTRDVRWLGPKEASAMNLITDPIGRP